jgi:protein tyrosine/serine phosphatase
MKIRILTTLIMLLLACVAWPDTRKAEWAQPLSLDGVPNLFKVTDNLYRSAQPTTAGMNNLAKLGIRTVICLRFFHEDSGRIEETSLTAERVPMNAGHIEKEDVVKVLSLLQHKDRGPFLVHCLDGADRTGVTMAMYRMVVQNWSREQALEELRDGGYGFHRIFKNIPRYLENVDIADYQKTLGN